MSAVDDLIEYLHAAPSPYHAVAEAQARLEASGYTAIDPSGWWPSGPGRFLVARGGALVAWVVPSDASPDQRFRIVGAHTDSPNLRIKPRPDRSSAGWRQLGVEVYGGALWNSWLDRDLGLSGRAFVRGAGGWPEERTFLLDRPLLRVPQLAIHLDRDVNNAGLKLNPQTDLTPVWGVGPLDELGFAGFLAEELGVAPTDVLTWDAMAHDLTPPALLGRDRDLLASARLDNLVSCWAAIQALTGIDPVDSTVHEKLADERPVSVVCLYDHEEVGSTSATGADGALLAHVLERSVLARGGTRADFLDALAGSVCLSADMAHATHPNHPERHEPDHQVAIDGGPVIKVNANQRYASDAATAALAIDACERAGIPHQVFVSRNDQPCGSTIGPLTAARLGIPTVDVGVPQLSMHSARELCAAAEPARLAALARAFLGG